MFDLRRYWYYGVCVRRVAAVVTAAAERVAERFFFNLAIYQWPCSRRGRWIRRQLKTKSNFSSASSLEKSIRNTWPLTLAIHLSPQHELAKLRWRTRNLNFKSISPHYSNAPLLFPRNRCPFRSPSPDNLSRESLAASTLHFVVGKSSYHFLGAKRKNKYLLQTTSRA